MYIYGSIQTTNKLFYNLLNKINEINSANLELKLRDFGYEIGYEDEHIYIYVYGNELEKEDVFLLFECEYKKGIEKSHGFVNEIVDLLKQRKIPYYSFEYVEGDGEGNDIGEEFEIRYP